MSSRKISPGFPELPSDFSQTKDNQPMRVQAFESLESPLASSKKHNLSKESVILIDAITSKSTEKTIDVFKQFKENQITIENLKEILDVDFNFNEKNKVDSFYYLFEKLEPTFSSKDRENLLGKILNQHSPLLVEKFVKKFTEKFKTNSGNKKFIFEASSKFNLIDSLKIIQKISPLDPRYDSDLIMNCIKYAASFDSNNCINFLIDNFYNTPNIFKHAFSYAIKNQNIKILNSIISSKHFIKNPSNSELLFRAIKDGSTDFAKSFLDKVPFLEHTYVDAIIVTLREKKPQILILLLDKILPPSDILRDCIDLLEESGEAYIINNVLQKKPNVLTEFEKIFKLALEKECSPLLTTLLKNGKISSDLIIKYLPNVLSKKNFSSLEILIKYSENPKEILNKTSSIILENHNFDVLDFLISKNLDLNIDKTEIIKKMIEHSSNDDLCINLISKIHFTSDELKSLLHDSLSKSKSNIFEVLITKKEFRGIDLTGLLDYCISHNKLSNLLTLIENHPKKSYFYNLAFNLAIQKNRVSIAFELLPKSKTNFQQLSYLLEESILTSNNKVLVYLLESVDKKSINTDLISRLWLQNPHPDFSILQYMIKKIDFPIETKSLFLAKALAHDQIDSIFLILNDSKIRKNDYLNILVNLFKNGNFKLLGILISKLPLDSEEKLKIIESKNLDLIFFLSDKAPFDQSAWKYILENSIKTRFDKLISTSLSNLKLNAKEIEVFLKLSISLENDYATSFIASKLGKPTPIILSSILRAIENSDINGAKLLLDKFSFSKENFDELIKKCIEHNITTLFNFILVKNKTYFDVESLEKICKLTNFENFLSLISPLLTKLKLNQEIINTIIPVIISKKDFVTLQAIISSYPEYDLKDQLEKIFKLSIELKNFDFLKNNFRLIENNNPLIVSLIDTSADKLFNEGIEFLIDKVKLTSEYLYPIFLRLLQSKKYSILDNLLSKNLLSNADMGKILIEAAKYDNQDFIYKWLKNQKLPLAVSESLFLIGLEKNSPFILNTILNEYLISEDVIKIAFSKPISDDSLNAIYSVIKNKPEKFKNDLIELLIKKNDFTSLKRLISKNFLSSEMLKNLFIFSREKNDTSLSIYILENAKNHDLNFQEFTPYLLENSKDDYLLELLGKFELNYSILNGIIKFAFENQKKDVFDFCCLKYPELKSDFNRYIFSQIIEEQPITSSFFSTLDFSFATEDQIGKLIRQLYEKDDIQNLVTLLSKASFNTEIIDEIILNSLKSHRQKVFNFLIENFEYSSDILKKLLRICISENFSNHFSKVLEKTSFNNQDLEDIFHVAITSKCDWAIYKILNIPKSLDMTFSKSSIYHFIETKNWEVLNKVIENKKIPNQELIDIFNKIERNSSISYEEKTNLYRVLFENYSQTEKIKIRYAPKEFLLDFLDAIRINLSEKNYERVSFLINDSTLPDNLLFDIASELIENHQEDLFIKLITPRLNSKEKKFIDLYNILAIRCMEVKNQNLLYFIIENSPNKAETINNLIKSISSSSLSDQKESLEFILPIISNFNEPNLLKDIKFSSELSPIIIDKSINFAISKGNYDIIDLLISLSTNKATCIETIINVCFKTFNFSYIKILLEKNSKFLEKSTIEDVLCRLIMLNQPHEVVGCLKFIQPLSKDFVTLTIKATSKHISTSTDFKSENLELLQIILKDKNWKKFIFSESSFLKNFKEIIFSAIWHNKKELFEGILESNLVDDKNIDEIISTCCMSDKQELLKLLLKFKKVPIENLIELANKTRSEILTQEILSSFKISYNQLSQLYDIALANKDSISMFLILKKWNYPITDLSSLRSLTNSTTALIKNAILIRREDVALYFLDRFKKSGLLNDIFISSIENLNTKITNYILEKNQVDEYSYLKAIKISCENKSLDSLSILLNSKFITNENYIRICNLLADFNHLDHIFKILEKFNPKRDDLNRFLNLGFKNKNYDFIISLFNKFNLDPQQTFSLCIEFENYDVLSSLFKKLSTTQTSILSRKLIDNANENNFNFIEAVLPNHKISDEVASEILPLAAKNNKIEIVKLILKTNIVNRLSIYSSLSETENKFRDVFELINNYEKKHRNRLGKLQ